MEAKCVYDLANRSDLKHSVLGLGASWWLAVSAKAGSFFCGRNL